MIKGYVIRLYPTKEQERSMWDHVGAARYIWNYMRELQETRHENGEKHLSAFDMINLLKPLKNDGNHDWLYDVSNSTIVHVCRDLDAAYQRFFRKIARCPRFKSRKKDEPRFPIRETIWFSDKGVKIERLGFVRFKTDFELPYGRDAKFSNPRIKYVRGKWYMSFGMECENQTPVLTDKAMGIDLGVKDLAIVAFGDEQIVYHNINKSKKVLALKKHIAHTQRSISRKYEANKVGRKFVKTNNIMREEEKLRRLNARLANIRKNYIHQTTAALIKMLPCRVTMEDLNVSGMMKNKHLSRAIQEQCLYEFVRQMQYKCEFNGIEFVQVGRFYPSSKTCSGCGSIKKDLKLKDRTYICPVCGLVIDRDYNAAINLMRYVA